MSRQVRTAPLLLLLAVIAAVAGQNDPALHRLNDRVIATAFTGQNEVVCTYCLFQVVSAAYQVGNEEVRREIEDALDTRDPRQLSEALLEEAERLTTLKSTLKGYYQRGVFDNCPVRTKREQCASIASILQRRSEPVDFRRPSTVNTINRAVELATDGKIKNLFENLASDTELVFVSTLLFNAMWESRLASFRANFTLLDGKNVTVPTLINEENMPFLDSADGVQGVSMAYEQPDIRLNCFKAKDSTKDIRELLYQQHYLALAAARSRLVQVRMPKFDIVSKKYSYVDLMQQLGITTMFRRGLGPRDGLKVDQLVHKAVIETDEHGTSAAGAAGIAIVPTSLGPRPTYLHFNEGPFVCSLVHVALGQPLFTAYIVDPRVQ